MTIAPVTDPGVLITKPLRDVKLSVQYFDGVGRPVNRDYVKDAATTSTTATATTTAVSSGKCSQRVPWTSSLSLS